MKKLLLLACLSFSISRSFACVNYFYGVDRSGHLHERSDFSEGFNTDFDRRKTVAHLQKLEAKLKKQHHYMLLSDYAVGLMKLGKYKEALVILQELYNYYPEDYKIAANLGTAYELNGDPASALTYIRRGMGLNPGSHEGSEWVHVKILEAKLAMEKDPAYLQKHTVLELSPEKEKDENICRHIGIQLKERFPFSKGPDPIMADLLEDLGDCYANLFSVEYAKAVYEVAREYYGDKSAELAAKIAEMKKIAGKFRNIEPRDSGETIDGRIIPFGDHLKVGIVRYQRLLVDNDDKNYKIDFTKLNTDTTALLALADLSLTARQSRTQALSETDSSGLVLLNDDSLTARSPEQSKTPEKKNMTTEPHVTPWYVWLFSISITVFIVWLIARVIKKSREEAGENDGLNP